jgi:hypothetical protein
VKQRFLRFTQLAISNTLTHHVSRITFYRSRPSSDDAPQVIYYLSRVGVTLFFVLGVDFFAINTHIKLPVAAPGEDNALQVVSVFIY